MTLWLIHKKSMSCGAEHAWIVYVIRKSLAKNTIGKRENYLIFLTAVTPSMLSSYVSPTFLRKAV